MTFWYKAEFSLRIHDKKQTYRNQANENWAIYFAQNSLLTACNKHYEQ